MREREATRVIIFAREEFELFTNFKVVYLPSPGEINNGLKTNASIILLTKNGGWYWHDWHLRCGKCLKRTNATPNHFRGSFFEFRHSEGRWFSKMQEHEQSKEGEKRNGLRFTKFKSVRWKMCCAIFRRKIWLEWRKVNKSKYVQINHQKQSLAIQSVYSGAHRSWKDFS